MIKALFCHCWVWWVSQVKKWTFIWSDLWAESGISLSEQCTQYRQELRLWHHTFLCEKVDLPDFFWSLIISWTVNCVKPSDWSSKLTSIRDRSSMNKCTRCWSRRGRLRMHRSLRVRSRKQHSRDTSVVWECNSDAESFTQSEASLWRECWRTVNKWQSQWVRF